MGQRKKTPNQICALLVEVALRGNKVPTFTKIHRLVETPPLKRIFQLAKLQYRGTKEWYTIFRVILHRFI